jgi:aldose 1-epimerase
MKKGIKNFLFLVFLITGCQSESTHIVPVKDEIWGESDGKEVKLFTLTNKNGMVIKVTNYGATLTYVSAPDKNSVFENVVIGFDSLRNYQVNRGQHGKTIGRFANRIGGGQFTLNGTTYNINKGNSPNAIHGGLNGFFKQVFDIDTVYSTLDSSVVSLHYVSADMEEGFPGNLTLNLSYILTGDNEIKIEYEAVTDKPTVVNFTNHSYFNLTSQKEPVLEHVLTIVADSVTPNGPDGLPTGKLLNVAGTPYDFTLPHKVGERIGQLERGYDINYKLRKNRCELALAAEVSEPKSGRLLQAFTTEPGMQFYTGNHSGLCLEMQHFPDSPNKPQFPNVVLNPGEKYRQLTIYKFSVVKP